MANLEGIGKILAAGFGDQVLLGVLVGLLDNVTPYRCYEYIKDDLSLFNWASDTDWSKYKGLVEQANIGDVTRERIVSELRKHKPELLGVIINHPKGLAWLDKQVAEMKKKLDLEA